jgi:hypothetical protein
MFSRAVGDILCQAMYAEILCPTSFQANEGIAKSKTTSPETRTLTTGFFIKFTSTDWNMLTKSGD